MMSVSSRAGRRHRYVRALSALGVVLGAALATLPFSTLASATSGWSSPTSIDGAANGSLQSLSCASASFCVGGDTRGDAVLYNGSSWTVDPGVARDTVDAISCLSSSFCLAGSFDAEAYVYHGSGWAITPSTNLQSVEALSCASTTFCVGVDDTGFASIYNGTTWGAAHQIDTSSHPSLSSISCPTTSFCAAFDEAGDVVTTSNGGSSWTSPSNVDSVLAPFLHVSCHSSSFCAAVDNHGNAFIFTTGSGWQETTGADGTFDIASVSCSTATQCVAVDVAGFEFSYDGTSWGSTTQIDVHGATAVSCPTATFCGVDDPAGFALTSSNGGTSWTTPTLVDTSGIAIKSVSCPTTTFCVAVDALGNVMVDADGTWSAPSSIDTNTLSGVSCASTTFCVAVDLSGKAFTYNGTTWSQTGTDPHQLSSVSCTTRPSIFCAGVDNDGNVFTTTTGTSWTLTNEDGALDLTSVSCPTASFCAAVDGSGNALIYNGTTWTKDSGVDSHRELSSVSCTTTPTTFCGAVDDSSSGDGLTYSGGSWSATTPVDANFPVSVSCPISGQCSGVDIAGAAFTYGSGGWTSPTPIDPGNGGLDAISCPAPAYCEAVDYNSMALAYDAPAATGLYVSQVSPYTGPINGDTAVHITGAGFTGATAVYFGGTPASGFTVNTGNLITVTAPPQGPGTVDVTVTTPAGSSAITSADEYTYTAAVGPETASCDPSCSLTANSGLDDTGVTVAASSTDPGSSITLSQETDTVSCGAAYDYAAAVGTFTAKNLAGTVTVTETMSGIRNAKKVKGCVEGTGKSSGSLLKKCKSSPAQAKKPCMASVTEKAGDKATAVMKIPATDPRFWVGAAGNGLLKSFTPLSGKPGAKVTIKGASLSEVTGVSFGGASATIVSAGSTKIVVKVPNDAMTGAISVTLNSGTAVSATPFTVT
jgi:hypothetical protein